MKDRILNSASTVFDLHELNNFLTKNQLKAIIRAGSLKYSASSQFARKCITVDGSADDHIEILRLDFTDRRVSQKRLLLTIEKEVDSGSEVENGKED